jgi:serine/threonine protein phosphatase PrpC
VGRSSSGLEAIRAKFFQSGVAAAPPSSGPNDPAEQLAGAVLDCDRQWLKQHAAKQAGSRRLSRVGACALACYCEGDKMVVANAGDCRGVVGRRRPLNSDEVSYDAVAISRDHTADDERERRKVGRRTQDPRPLRSTVNSHVINYDLPLRVAGSLMVTRALGDAYLKVAALSTSPFAQYCPYITAEPEMYTHQISARDDFIILASDGIWDHLSNEEAVQLVGLHLQTVARPDDSTRKHARTHARTAMCSDSSPVIAVITPAHALIEAVLGKVCEEKGVSREMLSAMAGDKRLRKYHDDLTVIVLCLHATVMAPGAAATVDTGVGTRGDSASLAGRCQSGRESPQHSATAAVASPPSAAASSSSSHDTGHRAQKRPRLREDRLVGVQMDSGGL